MSDDNTPMKTCTRCGNEYPATKEFFYSHPLGANGLRSWCKSCSKEYTSANTDKEYASQYAKQWYIANRDTRMEKAQLWRETNKSQISKQKKGYYRQNKERIVQYNRQWQSDNPDKVRAMKVNRRARVRNLPATFTDEQWIACLEYFNYCCAVCGSQLRDLFGNVEPHRDHWIPISYDGNDNPGTVADNIVCLCNSCNLSKQSKLPHVWLKEQFGSRKANEIVARIQAYFDSIDTDRTKRNAR